MIELNDAGKYYLGPYRSKITALHSVTLTLARGAVCGVVGPNGAGKSTLLSLLLGFLRPTRGTVRVNGLEPRDYTRTHGASYLPERFQLPRDWPVQPALEALAALDRVHNRTARVAEVLETLGLNAHAHKTIGTLSRGLLQRVGLAQALLARRELIVLDEPTEGLDPVWRLHFREQVNALRAEGRTVLLASHDLAEIERLAERVILLADGTVRDDFAITKPTGGPQRYRIALQTPLEQVSNILGNVEAVDGDRVFTVTMRDAQDLSARLAALLDLGAVIEYVQPADELEQRVRAALTDPDS